MRLCVVFWCLFTVVFVCFFGSVLLNDERAVLAVVFDRRSVPPVGVLQVLIEGIVVDQPVECVQNSVDVDWHSVRLLIGVFAHHLPGMNVVSPAWQLVADGLDLRGVVQLHDARVTSTSRLLSVGVVKPVVDRHHDRRARHHQTFNRVEKLQDSWRRRGDHHVEAVEDLPARVLCALVLLVLAAERARVVVPACELHSMRCLQGPLAELVRRSPVPAVQRVELLLQLLLATRAWEHVCLVKWLYVLLRDCALADVVLPPSPLTADLARAHLKAPVLLVSNAHHLFLVVRLLVFCSFQILSILYNFESSCLLVNGSALLALCLPQLGSPGVETLDQGIIDVFAENIRRDPHIDALLFGNRDSALRLEPFFRGLQTRVALAGCFKLG